MKVLGVKICTIALLLSFTSCQRENDDASNINVTQMKEAYCDRISSPDVRMCTEIPFSKDIADSKGLKAALLKNKRWKTGQTIRVKFLNGHSYLQDNVKKYADMWLDYANLKFEYVGPNEKADIKIAFKWDCDYSTWSYLGTDCRSIKQNQPTMNFGWFDQYTHDIEFQRVVLHEFGHALGLVHEHQNPLADIQWDKEAVYSYYNNFEGWDKEKVDRNIFDKYSTNQTNYTRFDDKSIMLYAIDENFTLDKFSIDWNRELSETDRNFISKIYPY
ncbi:MAG: matrixin family metalloprotease [Dysgonomonas sp.]